MYKERYDYKHIKEELKKLGWQENVGEKEGLFIDNDLRQICKINGVYEHCDKLLDEIKKAFENSDDNGFLLMLQMGFNSKVLNNRVIKLIDFDDWRENIFRFSQEHKFEGYPRNIIPDFALFINGIPVVIIEVKKTRGEDKVEEAEDQIERYEMYSPKLFKSVFLGIAYSKTKRYAATYPNHTQKPFNKPFQEWKDEISKNSNIFEILEPTRLLRILRYYTIPLKNGTRVVPRYMQFYAVEKVVNERIIPYLNGNNYKNKGLIWHWQGSGKSWEIVFLSRIFLQDYREKYTDVFIVVDRLELESQILDEYFNNIYGGIIPYERIDNRYSLNRILQRLKEKEEGKSITESKVWIVMLHKFGGEGIGNITEIRRKHILILRDEVHRSEYGILADNLHGIFPNAIKVGFTGTPNTKNDKNTFEAYSYPNEGEFYLHKYFVGDSIGDGYTLPIVWMSVENENIKLPEEKTREIVRKIIIGDIPEESYEEPANITLKDYLTSPKRIQKAADYILQRIEEDTEKFKFKAFVVAQNRYAAVMFCRMLREKLGHEKVGVVFTGSGSVKVADWQREIDEFINQEEKTNGKKWDEIIRDRKRSFKDENSPLKVLVVSDMLLQGYDAPILKVMYIHKVMSGHTLLQATARVNRPYKGKNKSFGLVVDLTGILLSEYIDTLRNYELYKEDISEDILKNLFISSDEKFNEFLGSFENLKKELNDILAPIGYNYEKLKSEWNNLDEKEVKRLVFWIFSNYWEIFANIKETLRTYKSIGAYPKKREYARDVEFLEELFNELRGLLNSKKRRRIKNLKLEILEILETELKPGGLAYIDESIDKILTPKFPEKIIIANFLLVEMEKYQREKVKTPLHYEVIRNLKSLIKRIQTLQEENARLILEIILSKSEKRLISQLKQTQDKNLRGILMRIRNIWFYGKLIQKGNISEAEALAYTIVRKFIGRKAKKVMKDLILICEKIHKRRDKAEKITPEIKKQLERLLIISGYKQNRNEILQNIEQYITDFYGWKSFKKTLGGS
ncbi:MAG: HsdR family type I site-specific deoxyribonuclease [candidate division WOR-3 bacterium]